MPNTKGQMEELDHAGALGDGGVIAVGRPVSRAGRPAPKEELPSAESLVPEEVVQPREESQGGGADQHHRPAIFVAPEPVDGAHDAEEDTEEEEEHRFDLHATGTFSFGGLLGGPWWTVKWSG
jgi:hypothetical protein